MVRRKGAPERVVVDLGAFGDVGASGTPPDAGREAAARHGGIGLDQAGRERGGPRADGAVSSSADEEVGAQAAARARGPRARGLVAVGTAAFLALSAWGTSTEIRDHERARQLMTAPGGVLSLAEAPRVTWSAPTESADDTAYLPGLVVVRRGTVLHALDAGTGVERWQVPVGGDPTCRVAASGTGGAAVVDPIVCWGGLNASPQVTVVPADGSSTTRALGQDVSWATGTTDGGLATVRAIGPEPPAGQVTMTPADGGGYSLDGTVTQGQDVVVRLEDAATGALRWERTIAFHPDGNLGRCGTVAEDRTGTQPTYTYTVRRPSVDAFGAFLAVSGCGVEATISPDGVVTGARASEWSYATPYVDGGVLDIGGSGAGVVSVLHGSGGAVTFPGQVLNPRATDGTPSDVVLVGSATVPLRAFGTDGAERWHNVAPYGELLVRTRDVAVLSLPEGGAAGVDLRTGERLWTVSTLVPGAQGAETVPVGAFTDGHVAALVMGHYPSTVDDSGGSITLGSTTADLVGLDLTTGAVRWRTLLPGAGTSIDAVEGHLVRSAQADSTVLGADGPGGGFVRHAPGTVYALG
ncbi:MAG: hypothetical protein BGO37_00510 [Cellulomonas sp. 73-92]|uniref:outer membrane protein assembly factor BamB family protein n=1 Tax=Cellulomonas sp. 73-92 TaxID=1895740 RepID=UPI0009297191|nr:PQQ-binding-like beta-propeller repeat protein [Cellulomonas sp. 73-92]OJV78878.1 MAG: hypothetical protein BGO37_00510 [Cellulomonas sp. 73-92]